MEQKSMDELLDVFNKQAASVKDKLTNLLVIVSDGRVPDKKVMNDLNIDMDALVAEYGTLKSEAQTYLDKQEMPIEGSRASAYVEAVNNSRSRIIKLQLEKAETILKRFLKVKSLIVEYEKALAPFKTKAAEVLGEISEDNIDSYISETEAPELFLKALGTEDLTGAEGLPILGEISKHYPPQIQWGLSGKKYFIEESKELKNEEVPHEEAEVIVDVPETENAEDGKASTIEPKTENEIAEINTTDSVSDNLTSEDESEIKEARENITLVDKAGDDSPVEAEPEIDDDSEHEPELSVDGNDSLPSILKATNNPKSCSPSATSFKNEIFGIARNFKEVRAILPLFTIFGVLSKEEIYRISICVDFCGESDSDRAKIDATVNELVRKGYIASFRYKSEDGEEDVFCLSSYCYGCLNKQTIFKLKDFWGVNLGEVKVTSAGEIEEDIASKFIRSNKRLAEYFYVSKGLVEPEEYRHIIGSSMWKGDYLRAIVSENKELFSCCVYDPEYYVDNDEPCVLVVGKDAYDKDVHFSGKDKIFICDNQSVYSLEKTSVNTSEEEIFDDDSDEAELKQKVDVEVKRESNQNTEKENNNSGTLKESIKPKDTPEVQIDNKEISAMSLLVKDGTPDDKEFCTVMGHLLNRKFTTKEELSSFVSQAASFAKAVGDVASNEEFEAKYPESRKLSAQIRLATHLMLNECSYTSDCLSLAFSNPEEEDSALMLSAYLFALLSPGMPYDYGLKTQTEHFLSNFEDYFDSFEAFKPLFNKFLSIKDVTATGFTPAMVSLLGNEAERDSYIKELQSAARECLVLKTPKTRMKTLPTLYSKCFGKGSDLFECMTIISEDDRSNAELVGINLDEFCDIQNGARSLSSDKIEDKLLQSWYDVNPKNKFKLEYDAKDQAMRQFTVRLEIMRSWIEIVNNINNREKDIERSKKLKVEILKLIQDVQTKPSWKKEKNANILIWSLNYIQDYLNGQVSKLRIYSEFINSGFLTVDNDGVPVIDAGLASVKYYEPWRLVLKHILSPRRPYAEVKTEILGGNLEKEDDGLKDNLHQLEMIGRLLEDTSDDYKVSDSQEKDAEASANERKTKFQEKLELAYTYNQINETEKEKLLDIVELHKPVFYESKDFACWRMFLEALEKQITIYAKERELLLRSRLDEKIKNNPESSLLREADRLLKEDMNLAVTEEYLTRFDAGETELDSGEVGYDSDYFDDFLRKENFDSLMQECKRHIGSSPLSVFGWNYIEKHLPADWSSRHRDDSKNLVTSWPKRAGTTSPASIKTLFTYLGFEVIGVKRDSEQKSEVFKVEVERIARSKADYLHPIAAFGTQMKSPINVILLFGNHGAQELVDKVTSLDLGGISIVLIDRPIDLATRRLIGEIFHKQKSGQNRFLLIDQILFLYLAMHQKTERLPAMLKCTLPYTTYQPFVRDGGSTADEMFCGRIQELKTIIDPNGACVVYGGRQLGKTALLERAESRCSKPKDKAFAVYVSIVRLTKEKDVVEALVDGINKKVDGKIEIPKCETIKDFCDFINAMFSKKQIASMLLLIDEVDDFLAAIADDAYRPIQPLVNLKRETKNNFKFVIAGLHNVCRAKNATKENGIFGQLGTPLCIKPLSPRDALQLISKPLRYLGFQIDRYPHLETILTNTNYYPGILQFFGYMLVDTLTKDYSRYYSSTKGNPPFTLQNEQLGAVMNSSDLNRSIKEKFRLSLELDPRYFMIARCITMLYHYCEEERKSGSWQGFSTIQIIDMAKLYKIHCLENLTKRDYVNLLDEMVEMGILAKPDENKEVYRLRRNSFVDIIGEDAETLEAEIEDNNTEEHL